MKDIDTVKRVRSWRNRQDICDFKYYSYNPATDEFVDPLRCEFISFNFKTGEGYPGYKQGQIEYIDYQNPVKLWTTLIQG